MKTKRTLLVQMLLVILMVLSCAAQATAADLEGELMNSLSAFYNDEATAEHAFYMTRYVLNDEQSSAVLSGSKHISLGQLEVAEGKRMIGRWIYFKEAQLSDKLLETFAMCGMDWKYAWTWNAYEAGERALVCVYEPMKFMVNQHDDGYEGSYLEQRMVDQHVELIEYTVPLGESRTFPYNSSSYEALIASCNGAFSIRGLDTAYVTGQNEYFRWEMYPFSIADAQGDVYEDVYYIYYRQVIPLEVVGGDPDGEQIDEYIIADQKEVAAIFEYVIDLIPDMNSAEKAQMMEHIQRMEEK